MALLTLRQFGGDKLRSAALRDLFVKTGDQLIVELAIAEQIAGLEHRSADRHVRFCLANTLVDRAGGMADLEPHVPQAIEDRLGNRLAPSGLLIRQDEQQ